MLIIWFHIFFDAVFFHVLFGLIWHGEIGSGTVWVILGTQTLLISRGRLGKTEQDARIHVLHMRD